jgi:hypothetical protein
LSAVRRGFLYFFSFFLELKGIGAFAPELKKLDIYYADSAKNSRVYGLRVYRDKYIHKMREARFTARS